MVRLIVPGKLAVSSKTYDAAKNFNTLRTTADVRSFLVLCNVFRRFVPDFGPLSDPLNRNLTKDTPSRFDHLSDD